MVVNKLHVEGVFPTSMTPEVTKIGPDGAASLLGTRHSLYKLPKCPWRPITIIIGYLLQKTHKNHPGHLVTIPLVYMWGDAHFYWSHRLLHTPWLYKRSASSLHLIQLRQGLFT